MGLDVFYQVVVPLFGMDKSVLICISTPLDTFNFFSMLIDTMDPETGHSLFLVARVRLSCDRCIARDAASHCTHNLKMLPPWKSPGKMDAMKLLMKNQLGTLERENYGIISNDAGSYIERHYLKRWFEVPRYLPPPGAAADFVVMAMDPNGMSSSNASETAIVSIAFYGGERVVS